MMIRHTYELINKGSNELILNINILIEHGSHEYLDFYDHVALRFIDNQFKGKYSIYSNIREQIHNYLVENKIIEIVDQKTQPNDITVYQVKLLQTKILELI